MIARMWEVRALGSGFDELLTWVCDVALPQVEVLPSHVSSDVYSSTDHRIVVISKWRNTVRMTTSISTFAKAAPTQRRVPPPNGMKAKVEGRLPTKRCGSNRSGSSKSCSRAWMLSMATTIE